MPIFLASVSGLNEFGSSASSGFDAFATGGQSGLAGHFDSLPGVNPIRVWHNGEAPTGYVVLQLEHPGALGGLLAGTEARLEVFGRIVGDQATDDDRLAQTLDDILPVAAPSTMPAIAAIGPEFVYCEKEHTFHAPPACP